MVSLGLPGRAEDAAPLQDRLFFEHRIEVPIIPFAASRILRVSMQRYVSMDDVARLAEALPALL
jgi:isopenicillin-N epimerase